MGRGFQSQPPLFTPMASGKWLDPLDLQVPLWKRGESTNAYLVLKIKPRHGWRALSTVLAHSGTLKKG